MKSRSNQKHMIDMVFPLALFFVFLLSALSVLLLAADLYSGISRRSAQTNSAGIAGAYLTETIHQNDRAGQVRLGELDQNGALVLEHREQDRIYRTYIYFYDGMLRELMVSGDLQPNPARGRAILPLSSFRAEQVGDNLLRFSCTDLEQHSTSVLVSVRSGEV